MENGAHVYTYTPRRWRGFRLSQGRLAVQTVGGLIPIWLAPLEHSIPTEHVERRAHCLLHDTDLQRPIALIDRAKLFSVELR